MEGVENIGIRQLKDRLSYYLQEARKGEVITITRWGKPVARLVPASMQETTGLPPKLEERMWELVSQGAISWSGSAINLPEPVAVNRGPMLLSDLVVKDRE